ncbi:MAG: DUF4394 domain-containing protein [Blastocatellia bacterium]|nr:DUF4394 domain-containing protein [Blastocatellia bacterium]
MNKRYFFGLVAIFAVLAACAFDNNVNAQNIRRCSTNNSNNLLIIGLTADQRLVCFREVNPGRASVIGPVTGLSGDSALIGIDYRVQDGQLYGVGNAGGVYRIDTGSGAATFVNNLTVALDGTSFGVDFNPAADRLRIISNTGQNLRHNVNLGGVTINDGTLTYTAPPASPVAALGVTGAAYTNNDLDASTATTLFDIDSTMNQVVIQSPANNGLLAATGKLGVDTSDVVGFDIYSTLQGAITVDNEGFAVLTSAEGISLFYSVSLLTGRATLIGGFGVGIQIVDIAIPLNQR